MDVFLSLSGYLITRNIVRQLQTTCFSLRQFYTRRFFRLYPAATATALFTLLTSFAIFSDELAGEASASALSSMLFSSNVFFHLKTDYFDTSAILKPLLHTWSLSLEEQFYFVWAPLIVLVNRVSPKRTALVAVLVCLTLTSLLSAVYLSPRYPSLAFFELPARIYQFSAGALLSVLLNITPSSTSVVIAPVYKSYLADSMTSPFLKSAIFRQLAAEFMSAFALVGLLLSYIYTPREATSLQMLPTTLCTCAIIALPNTLVAEQLLSTSVLRRIGHLSYAAYLVHWPIYVYGRYLMMALNVHSLYALFFTIVTFVCASALKFFVEDPVRFGKPRRRVFFMLTVLLTLLVACVGISTHGFSFRTGRETDEQVVVRNLQALALPTGRKAACHMTEAIVTKNNGEVTSMTCQVGAWRNGTRSSFAMVGNSFAAMYLQTLHVIGHRRGVWFPLTYGFRCRFHARANRHLIDDKDELNCLRLHDRIWEQIAQLPPNSSVILSVANGFGSAQGMRDSLIPVNEEVRALGHRLVLLSEPPGLSAEYEAHYACKDLFGLPIGRVLDTVARTLGVGGVQCRRDIPEGAAYFKGRDWQSRAYDELFANELKDAKLINLFNVLCDGRSARSGGETEACGMPQDVVVKGGETETGYKRDLIHLSTAGSYWMVDTLEEQLFGDAR